MANLVSNICGAKRIVIEARVTPIALPANDVQLYDSSRHIPRGIKKSLGGRKP